MTKTKQKNKQKLLLITPLCTIEGTTGQKLFMVIVWSVCWYALTLLYPLYIVA